MSLHQPILKHPAVLFRTALLIQLLAYIQRLPRLDIDIWRRIRLLDGYVIEHHCVGLRNAPVFCSLPVLAPPFCPDCREVLAPIRVPRALDHWYT